jgi:serine protease
MYPMKNSSTAHHPRVLSLSGARCTFFAVAVIVSTAVSAAQSAPSIPASFNNGASSPRFMLDNARSRFASDTVIEIKLRSGADIQLGRLSARGARTASFNALETLLIGYGATRFQPLFDTAAIQAVTRRGKVVDSAYADVPDLSQWHHLSIPRGSDIDAIIRKLKANSLVAHAYRAPLPAPLPNTPDFRWRQTYMTGVANNGIDSDYAHTIDGGRGNLVQVVDIEYQWNRNHEDLSRLRLADTVIDNNIPVYPTGPGFGPDHGTAVMGILGGDNNGYGVTGIVPRARLRVVHVMNVTGYRPGNAILRAAEASSAGDVILIEQQAIAPQHCGPYSNDYVPLEYYPAVYDATRFAISRGIHVVAAAGNGSVNLDNPGCFGQPFPNGVSSGAIIVGAGTSTTCGGFSPPRSRLGFSSYGSRVNVQAWGECVTTAGYGDLQNAGANRMYTGFFAGTSSASPIVAGAVASLASIAELRGLSLSPREMRRLISETGIAQGDPGNGWIGPLPNMRNAIANLNAYAAIH